MHLCSCGTKIEEITSLRTGDVICHRHITTGLRISPVFCKNKRHPKGCLCFWRSRRDSNSRAAFGDYTISSRARYDHFDTTPYSLALNNSIVYYSKDLTIVKKKMTNLERKFQGGAERAARTLLRLAATPDFSLLHHVCDRFYRRIHCVTHFLHGFTHGSFSGFGSGEHRRTHDRADHQAGTHTAQIRAGTTHHYDHSFFGLRIV